MVWLTYIDIYFRWPRKWEDVFILVISGRWRQLGDRALSLGSRFTMVSFFFLFEFFAFFDVFLPFSCNLILDICIHHCPSVFHWFLPIFLHLFSVLFFFWIFVVLPNFCFFFAYFFMLHCPVRLSLVWSSISRVEVSGVGLSLFHDRMFTAIPAWSCAHCLILSLLQ